MKRLILIDGHSLLYRAFYALPPLRTKDGFPTNATYGLLKMLIKLFKEYNPSHCGVAFDTPKPTFRHKEFTDYKITRPEMPDDLKPQISITKEILNALGIKTLEFEGFEADDIIGTLSLKAEQEGYEVFIVSGDRDALQLVSDKTKLLRTIKGISDIEVYDLKRVIGEYGIEPNKIPHFIALKGDQSDNIPGIPSIGPKRAIELLKKYGSIEEIISKSGLDLIMENKERLKTYLSLATIRRDLPLNIDIESLKISQPDRVKLLSFLKRLEFQSIISELGLTEEIVEIKPKMPFSLVQTNQDLKNALKELKEAEELYIKVSTSEHPPMWASIESICLSTPHKAFIFPTKFFPIFELLNQLHYIFSSDIPKIGCDLKRDLTIIKREGFDLKEISFDLALASYLIDPERNSHSLENLSLSYLGEYLSEGDKIRRLAREAELAFTLKPILKRELEENELLNLFEKVELPLMNVLADMEIEGIMVDDIALLSLEAEMEKEIKKLEEDIFSRLGLRFNLNSPKQLGEVLFEHLKIDSPSKGKKLSTDAQTLIELMRQKNPYSDAIEKILLYRQLSKIKSSYISSLPKLIHPRTRCIHTSFNQTITATGRLSSSDPNLQNIPVKTPLGKAIRRAFRVRDEKNIFISADYSQIELRILAHFSQDPKLLEAFERNLDIHSKTASELFGVREEEVTEEQRRMAKVINFGVIYGMSPHGLAQELGISQREAEEYIKRYFSKYPKVKEFIEKLLDEARENGFVKTILGRKRKIEGINSRYKKLREQAERCAINTPMQGSAADIIKLAMIELHRRLNAFKILLQIHDELLFEGPEEKLHEDIEKIESIMTSVIKLSVPIKVSIKVGKNWGDMIEYKKHVS